MKETKEQLVVEVATLKADKTRMSDNDERRRIEFAKAFHWNKPQEMYMSKNNESLTPTWEQIFVEVGKLLAARTFYDLEGNVSNLECKLEDLEKILLKNVNPNL